MNQILVALIIITVIPFSPLTKHSAEAMSSFALTLHIPSVVSVRNTKLLGRSVSDCGRNWSGLPKSRSRRGYGLCCKAELSELAPAVSAGYGALLLGGGLFACKLLTFSLWICFAHFHYKFDFFKFYF